MLSRESGEFHPDILIDKIATRGRDYGEIANSVGRGINYCTFIDNGAVWMMSTVHDVANETLYVGEAQRSVQGLAASLACQY
jgi:hypothetical protein